MTAKDAIRCCLTTARTVTTMLLDDLGDADLLIRPAPGANHIAWQLGHLISAERTFVERIKPGTAPELPEGFVDAHGKEAAGNDDPSAFLGKGQYLELYEKQREATLGLLEQLDESTFDDPVSEPMPPVATTIGEVFMLAGTHELMHTGQYTPVRRQLGKKTVF